MIAAARMLALCGAVLLVLPPATQGGWGYGQRYVRSSGYRGYACRAPYARSYSRPVHYRSFLAPRSYSAYVGPRYNYATLRYGYGYSASPLGYQYSPIGYRAPVYGAPVISAPVYSAPIFGSPIFYNCSTPRYYQPTLSYAGYAPAYVSYGTSPSYASYGYVPGFANYEGPPFAAQDVPFFVSLTADGAQQPATPEVDARSAGWRLLAEGRHTDAVSAFAYESEQDPQLGEPRIGYALAAAVRGDLSSGVWAMRRACRYEPAALGQIDIDEGLRPHLEQLVGKYAASDVGDRDAAFMSAALHLLLGDTPAARAAVQRASQSGDHSQSTRSLQEMLQPADGQ